MVHCMVTILSPSTGIPLPVDGRSLSAMQSFQENQYPGGFLHSILPFPPPSTPTSASTAISVLPPQRAHPLTPGSSKERSFIEYVDRRLVDISGRYENRHNVGTLEDEDRTTKATGYESFEKLAVDLESVIDVIWVSGTRKSACASLSRTQ